MVKLTTNDKNLDFYRNIDLSTFHELARLGGFDTHKDLQEIAQYFKHDSDILEIGAGFGRCLDYFISRNHQGRLIALEKSEPLVAHLRKSYQGKATILDDDIKLLHLDAPVDIALWMWSGIIDFSPSEQSDAIHTIFALLKSGGRLFIDVPRIGIQTIAQHQDAQNLVLTTAFGEIHAYIPNDEDMAKYCASAGFQRFQRIDYETATDKKRTIYMLEK